MNFKGLLERRLVAACVRYVSDNDDYQTPLTHKEQIKVGRPFNLLISWDDGDTLANSICVNNQHVDCSELYTSSKNLDMITILLN